MPHLISDRPRLLSLRADVKDPSVHDRWENTQAIIYIIGGISFIVGSVFFFPALGRFMNIGAWVFFGGSILYLIVSGHDFAEVLVGYRHGELLSRMERSEFAAAVAYLSGTILFLLGSLFFLSWIDRVQVGAWCFIVGSLLFVLGSSINILQVPAKSKRGNLQMINLTAVTFVSGSILFTVASVPYLWHFTGKGDRQILDAFLAAQYLVGSILFSVGGVTNAFRSLFKQRERKS